MNLFDICIQKEGGKQGQPHQGHNKCHCMLLSPGQFHQTSCFSDYCFSRVDFGAYLSLLSRSSSKSSLFKWLLMMAHSLMNVPSVVYWVVSPARFFERYSRLSIYHNQFTFYQRYIKFTSSQLIIEGDEVISFSGLEHTVIMVIAYKRGRDYKPTVKGVH